MHLPGSPACPGPLLAGSSACPGPLVCPGPLPSWGPPATLWPVIWRLACTCGEVCAPEGSAYTCSGWSAPAASWRTRLSLALSPSSFPFLEPELGLHCAPLPSPTMLHREPGAPSLAVQSSGRPKPSPTGQFPWNEIFAPSTPVCLQ